MYWLENLKLAADTLWVNRLRSLLTMLGLIIGISSVILVTALGVGAQRFVKEQFQDIGTNVVPSLMMDRALRPSPTLVDAEAIRTGAVTVQNVSSCLWRWSSRLG